MGDGCLADGGFPWGGSLEWPSPSGSPANPYFFCIFFTSLYVCSYLSQVCDKMANLMSSDFLSTNSPVSVSRRRIVPPRLWNEYELLSPHDGTMICMNLINDPDINR